MIAESYERIHRSNLLGMGVLPLQFSAGESADNLGLTGTETYDIALPEHLSPVMKLQVKVRPNSKINVSLTCFSIRGAMYDWMVLVDY